MIRLMMSFLLAGLLAVPTMATAAAHEDSDLASYDFGRDFLEPGNNCFDFRRIRRVVRCLGDVFDANDILFREYRDAGGVGELVGETSGGPDDEDEETEVDSDDAQNEDNQSDRDDNDEAQNDDPHDGNQGIDLDTVDQFDGNDGRPAGSDGNEPDGPNPGQGSMSPDFETLGVRSNGQLRCNRRRQSFRNYHLCLRENRRRANENDDGE